MSRFRARAKSGFDRYIVPMWRGAGYLLNPVRHGENPRLDIPAPSNPTAEDLRIAERIMASYAAMKRDEATCEPVFAPSTTWKAFSAKRFGTLGEATRANDADTFARFLINSGISKTFLGFESTVDLLRWRYNPLGRAYLKNAYFRQQVRNWQWFFGERVPLEALDTPRHGNLPGAIVGNNVFITPWTPNYHIFAHQLRSLAPDNAPTFAEVGGGNGKLSWFLLNGIPDFKYFDFDLPEVLCIAAHYVIKCFPEKRVLLYGEHGESNNPDFSGFDIVMYPAFAIDAVSSTPIDVFFNKNSFGEMTQATVDRYLQAVKGNSRYIVHANHEWAPARIGEEKGAIAPNYDISDEAYELIVRYPEFGHLMWDEHFRWSNDIFYYVYRRRD